MFPIGSGLGTCKIGSAGDTNESILKPNPMNGFQKNEQLLDHILTTMKTYRPQNWNIQANSMYNPSFG